MDSGLIGLHSKGLLLATLFAISRDQLSLAGPKTSRYRKIQKIKNTTHTKCSWSYIIFTAHILLLRYTGLETTSRPAGGCHTRFGLYINALGRASSRKVLGVGFANSERPKEK